MGKYVGNTATNTAVEAVKAALGSGAIKLLGPVHRDDAETYAKADAKYLATLLNEVLDQISER